MAKSAAKVYNRRQYGHIVQMTNVVQQIAALYQLLLDDLARCHSHVRRGDYAARGEQIDHALSVVTVLRNHAVGLIDDRPENTLPAHLIELYDACLSCLMAVIAERDVDDNIAHLDRAWSMINTVKSAWDELAAHPSGE